MLSVIKRTPGQEREFENLNITRALDAIRKGEYEPAFGFAAEAHKDFLTNPSDDRINKDMLAFATVFGSYASVLKEMATAEVAIGKLFESDQLGPGASQFCLRSLNELKTAQAKLRKYVV